MDWAAKVLAALPLALVSLYPGPTSSIVPPTATLSYGAVQGIQTTLAGAEYPVNKFLGIPYAEPPQRFSPAAEVLPRKDPIKATAFGATCPQSFGVPGVGPDPVLLKEVFSNGVQPESEDCLTVNVFASAKRSSDLRPVLVFIYGGAWQISSSVQLDMSAFAAYEDIVGVTMNYRGTVFGFPSSPEIPLEQRNLGLLDQKLALQWVQKHIAKFGGDPTKVTIWGQSAGAMSVDSHLMANANDAKSRPFRAAVMSSGQLSFGIASLRATGHEAWDDLSNAVGCTDEADRLACMRAQPVGALQNAMRDLKSSFWPVNDDVTVFADSGRRWRQGKVAKVPVMTGTIAEEGRSLVNHAATLNAFLDAYFDPRLVSPEMRSALLASYPRDRLPTDFDVAAAMVTDFVWQCPQALLANVAAANGMPTWRYYFNASVISLVPANYSWLQKFHGSEIYLLDSDDAKAPLSPQAYILAQYLRAALARFTKNPFAGPGWPAVGSRFAPLDIAVLGDAIDASSGGATPASSHVVDGICELYVPLYPILESLAESMVPPD